MDDPRAAIAGVFDRASETYDGVGVEFFSLVGRNLVALAHLRPGERVLDAGCGRGAVLFAAAEAVGADGLAHGIDLAPGMVERTAAVARDRGLDQVRVEVMDAQEPVLEHSAYDVVFSSLVVFFLPDPLAGLRAWRSATRDGGRLGLTTFVSRDDERWAWLEEVFPERNPRATSASNTADGSRDGDGNPDDEGPFSSIERLHELLGPAGWMDPRSDERTHDVTFTDNEQVLAWSWSHGMRRNWERLPEDRHEEVRARMRRHLDAMCAEHGELGLRMEVRYTTATAG